MHVNREGITEERTGVGGGVQRVTVTLTLNTSDLLYIFTASTYLYNFKRKKTSSTSSPFQLRNHFAKALCRPHKNVCGIHIPFIYEYM